jgi:hypothetical protein
MIVPCIFHQSSKEIIPLSLLVNSYNKNVEWRILILVDPEMFHTFCSYKIYCGIIKIVLCFEDSNVTIVKITLKYARLSKIHDMKCYSQSGRTLSQPLPGKCDQIRPIPVQES